MKFYLRARHKENYEDELFLHLSKIPGTGAAGGLVAAIISLFEKAKIISGMEFVN